MVKTEAHLRCNELISRHTTEVPFPDITRCVAGISEDLSDAGLGQGERQIVGDGFVIQRIFARHEAASRWYTYWDIREGCSEKTYPLVPMYPGQGSALAGFLRNRHRIGDADRRKQRLNWVYVSIFFLIDYRLSVVGFR